MAPFQPTTAEMRALDQIATPDGRFAVLAMDQRVSLRHLRARVDRPADDATLRSIKSDVLSILGPYASASLLDPELALPDLVQAGVQSGQRGLLVSIENSRDRRDPDGRLTSLIPGFGAEGVRRYGGTAAKLLITIRPGTTCCWSSRFWWMRDQTRARTSSRSTSPPCLCRPPLRS
jgi:sulfofructosephosphate aldolase